MQQGINFVGLSETMLNDWKKTAGNAIERFTKENTLDPALLNKIQELLAGFRNSKSSVAAK